MAIFCSHCGEELPRDDTRFCSNCGAVRTARLTNPSSIAGIGKTPLPSMPENAQEVAKQKELPTAPMSPLHMKQRTEWEEAPTWMSNLQRESRKDGIQPAKVSQQQEIKAQDALIRDPEQEHFGQQQSVPESLIHTTIAERRAQAHDASGPEQLEFPDLPSTPQTFSSMRELRVKVWNEANPIHQKIAPKEDFSVQHDPRPPLSENKQVLGAVAQNEYPIEDVPTRVVESVPAVQPQQANFPSDDVPTTPLLLIPEVQEQPLHSGQSQSLGGGQQRLLYGQEVFNQQKPEESLDNATDIANIRTTQLQVQGRDQVASALVPQRNHPIEPRGMPPSVLRGEKGHRLPLIIGVAAVAFLLVLALGSWIIIFQPFSVSPATNVQLSYVNAKMGVSLQYPNGWKTPQADYKKKVITLLDASDTAQVTISLADAATGSLNNYLQQQATKLGMSNPKPGAVTTFAAASWQQIQGDVQVKGAQYTCEVFATVYKNHLYTLTQMAPSNIYPDEERLVFAPTRLSLRLE